MLTLGSDPELFLMDGNKPRSVIGLLGGTKDNPEPVPELGKGFGYQEDNVVAEYNIPAVITKDSWHANHLMMLNYLEKKLAPYGKLKAIASAIMPESELEDPRAHIFGCEPDFNVWDVEINPRPCAMNPALRSAGGHVHFGFRMSKMDKIMFGRYCDYGMGLWSVLEDEDKGRRELYGSAGAIRFKPYGIEYRTLSNYWVVPEHIPRIWDRAYRCYKAFNARSWHGIIDKHGKEIRKAINTSDKALANSLLEFSLQ